MAKTDYKLQRLGLTPGKAALMGLLAVVLGGVLYRQFGATDSELAAAPRADASRTRPAPPSGPASASAPAALDAQPDPGLQAVLAQFDQSRWRTPDLSEVTAYDPFALPAAFPQASRAVLDPDLAADGADGSAAALQAQQLAEAVEQMQRQLEELQQRGVHVIINVRDHYVAMIGDRTLHVGDEINGFVVTAIQPDGVRVERKDIE